VSDAGHASVTAEIALEYRRTKTLLSARDLGQQPAGRKPMQSLIRLLQDEQGATAVEYGLIVAAIAGLIIAVVFVLGNKINNTFNNIQSSIP
jgi:pilus assembly protein Flp/PilA